MPGEGHSGAGRLAPHRVLRLCARHGGNSTYGLLRLESTASVALVAVTFSENSSCDVGADGMVIDNGSTFVRCP